MNLALLKTMILSIIFMGVVILAAGLILLFFKQQVAPHMRYLLPIPPIGVASYVFVYNMFSKYEGHLPGTALDTLIEIAWASGISFVLFFVFSLILLFLVDLSQ